MLHTINGLDFFLLTVGVFGWTFFMIERTK